MQARAGTASGQGLSLSPSTAAAHRAAGPPHGRAVAPPPSSHLQPATAAGVPWHRAPWSTCGRFGCRGHWCPQAYSFNSACVSTMTTSTAPGCGDLCSAVSGALSKAWQACRMLRHTAAWLLKGLGWKGAKVQPHETHSNAQQ